MVIALRLENCIGSTPARDTAQRRATVLRALQKGPIFPNLEQITLRKHLLADDSIWPLIAGTIHTLRVSFMRTAYAVAGTNEPSIADVQKFLRSLATYAPAIDSLTIFGVPKSLPRSLIMDPWQLQYLIIAKCHITIDLLDELFSKGTRLHSLSIYRIDEPRDERSLEMDLARGTLRSLKILLLQGVLEPIVTFMRAISAPALEKLTVDTMRSLQLIPLPDMNRRWVECFDAISAFNSSLCDLDFSAVDSTELQNFFNHAQLSQIVRPIIAATRMQKIDLYFPVSFAWKDSDFLSMIAAWPELNSFTITCVTKARPWINSRILAAFAQLANLETLILEVPMQIELDTLNATPAKHVCRCLELLYVDIQLCLDVQPLAMARYIDALFPCIDIDSSQGRASEKLDLAQGEIKGRTASWLTRKYVSSGKAQWRMVLSCLLELRRRRSAKFTSSASERDSDGDNSEGGNFAGDGSDDAVRDESEENEANGTNSDDRSEEDNDTLGEDEYESTSANGNEGANESTDKIAGRVSIGRDIDSCLEDEDGEETDDQSDEMNGSTSELEGEANSEDRENWVMDDDEGEGDSEGENVDEALRGFRSKVIIGADRESSEEHEEEDEDGYDGESEDTDDATSRTRSQVSDQAEEDRDSWEEDEGESESNCSSEDTNGAENEDGNDSEGCSEGADGVTSKVGSEAIREDSASWQEDDKEDVCNK
ncbi:hypothetical protein WOLCODRAFT_155094 [Wolfiporia cocos MD-104 SS10]|uniref:Uncharacterized protein n=1 Tax=Wolfiporia cocos (strain MD-104) TaxID=742152 RepID=A0A2H3JYK8_WOLCO|nr:hypothetical protein WOLCODRAFT_155094 [Wolfiporia cocos MD-104 SS10]